MDTRDFARALAGLRDQDEEFRRLRPLLESIAREIGERDASLDRIERELDRLEKRGRGEERAVLRLISEAAVERRELRRVVRELQRLGCVLLGRRPPTIGVPRAGGSLVWLWQPGPGS